MTPAEAAKIYSKGKEIIVAALCDLSATIEKQEKEIDTLKLKIAKLLKNSSNSGKKPSSDDITKKSKKKGKSKRNIGGQFGHPKNERPLFLENEINEFHKYVYLSCPECNAEVSITEGNPRIIQQIEIIEMPLVKYQHSSYPVWCENCGKVHYKPFPPDIAKESLFKSRLTALVAYMKGVCHCSFSTIRKFIRDVLNEKVSRGYLRKIVGKVSDSLEQPYEELLNLLPLETKVNVDETGHKENGDKFWTWVFKADLYVLFKIDESRGSKVLIDVLGKEFEGVLGCDFFSAYKKYMKDFNVTIQFCIAHLIRNIRFLTGLPDRETKAYGEKLLQAIKKMFKIIHTSEKMDSAVLNKKLRDAKRKILAIALEDVPSKKDKGGKEEKREAQNMAHRFKKFGEAYFEFITTPGIDPTNNAAERAIRFIVIDRLITQGTRSEKGRETNERLWTVIATCRLQGRSAFNFIFEAVKAHFKGYCAPSLLLDTS